MKTYILWIERDIVKWFRIEREGMKTRVLHRREIRHHTNNAPENLKNPEKFSYLVAESIHDAEEILLMGPSLGKERFRDHLERRHHGLAAKVVGLLTLGPHSDNQILARSREFFRQYDVFGVVPNAKGAEIGPSSGPARTSDIQSDRKSNRSELV